MNFELNTVFVYAIAAMLIRANGAPLDVTFEQNSHIDTSNLISNLSASSEVKDRTMPFNTNESTDTVASFNNNFIVSLNNSTAADTFELAKIQDMLDDDNIQQKLTNLITSFYSNYKHDENIAQILLKKSRTVVFRNNEKKFPRIVQNFDKVKHLKRDSFNITKTNLKTKEDRSESEHNASNTYLSENGFEHNLEERDLSKGRDVVLAPFLFGKEKPCKYLSENPHIDFENEKI